MWRGLVVGLLLFPLLLNACGGSSGRSASAPTTGTTTIETGQTATSPASEYNHAASASAEEQARLEHAIKSAFRTQLGMVKTGLANDEAFPLPGQPCHRGVLKFLSCPCSMHQILVSPTLISDYKENGNLTLNQSETAAVEVDAEEGSEDAARCKRAAEKVMSGIS